MFRLTTSFIFLCEILKACCNYALIKVLVLKFYRQIQFFFNTKIILNSFIKVSFLYNIQHILQQTCFTLFKNMAALVDWIWSESIWMPEGLSYPGNGSHDYPSPRHLLYLPLWALAHLLFRQILGIMVAPKVFFYNKIN